MALTASTEKANLTFTDGTPTMELPIYKGTIGPEVIDIRALYGKSGKFTYDPGLPVDRVVQFVDHRHRR